MNFKTTIFFTNKATFTKISKKGVNKTSIKVSPNSPRLEKNANNRLTPVVKTQLWMRQDFTRTVTTNRAGRNRTHVLKNKDKSYYLKAKTKQKKRRNKSSFLKGLVPKKIIKVFKRVAKFKQVKSFLKNRTKLMLPLTTSFTSHQLHLLFFTRFKGFHKNKSTKIPTLFKKLIKNLVSPKYRRLLYSKNCKTSTPPTIYLNTIFTKKATSDASYKAFFTTLVSGPDSFFKKSLQRLKKKTAKHNSKKKRKTYNAFAKNKLVSKKILPKSNSGAIKVINKYKPTKLKKSLRLATSLRTVKRMYKMRTDWLLNNSRRKYNIGSFSVKKTNKYRSSASSLGLRPQVLVINTSAAVLYQRKLPVALSRLSKESLITSYSKFLKAKKVRRGRVKRLLKSKKFATRLRHKKKTRKKKIHIRPNRRLRRGRKLTFQNVLHIRRVRSLGTFYPALSPKPFKFKSWRSREVGRLRRWAWKTDEDRIPFSARKIKVSLMNRHVKLIRTLNVAEKTSSIVSVLNHAKNVITLGLPKQKLVLNVKKTRSTASNLGSKKLRTHFYKKSTFSLQNKISLKKLRLKGMYSYLSFIKKPLQTRSLGRKGLGVVTNISITFFWKTKHGQNLNKLSSACNRVNSVQLKQNWPVQLLLPLPGQHLIHLETNHFLNIKVLLRLTRSELVTTQLNQIPQLNYNIAGKCLTRLINDSSVSQLLSINSSEAPILYSNSAPEINLGSPIHSPISYTDEYSTLSVFINNFYNSKAAKYVSILTRTSYHAAEPNTIVYTSSLKRNQLNTKTFNPRSLKSQDKILSLLFYRQMVAGHRQLLMSVSQKIKVNNLSLYRNVQPSKNLNLNGFSIDPALLFINRGRNQKFRKQLIVESCDNRPIAKKKAFRAVKPLLSLRLGNLRKFMRKNKLRKTLNSLILFTEKPSLFKKRTRKSSRKVPNRHRDIYILKNKRVSHNLAFTNNRLKPSTFYYNYAPSFTQHFFKVKVTRPRALNQKYLIKTTSRRVLKKAYKRRIYGGLKKNKKNKKPKLVRNNNTQRVAKIFRPSKPKNTTVNKLILYKSKTKNYLMGCSRVFTKRKYLLSKAIFRFKKRQAQILTNKVKYKNFLQKVSKYTKKRLVLSLSDISHSSYKTTHKFKVDRLLTTTSKPHLTSTLGKLIYPSTKLTTPLMSKHFRLNLLLNSDNFIATFMRSPFMMKFLSEGGQEVHKRWDYIIANLLTSSGKKINLSNLSPSKAFRYDLLRKIHNSTKSQTFQGNITPWYYNTLVRFMEHFSGKKCVFQFYPFVNNDVDHEFFVRYKKWIPRLSYYERRLGHRFFLEEAIHIMHLSFFLKDPKLICSWLKAIILRISFWKTRSIFRFLKYLIHNYYRHVFADVGLKGLKIKLKGKISAAGNSRKRTILYRTGQTSHSHVALRVVNEFMTISTFTGVMGFQIWLFY